MKMFSFEINNVKFNLANVLLFMFIDQTGMVECQLKSCRVWRGETFQNGGAAQRNYRRQIRLSSHRLREIWISGDSCGGSQRGGQCLSYRIIMFVLTNLTYSGSILPVLQIKLMVIYGLCEKFWCYLIVCFKFQYKSTDLYTTVALEHYLYFQSQGLHIKASNFP